MNKKQLFCMWVGVTIIGLLGLSAADDKYFRDEAIIYSLLAAIITTALICTFRGKEKQAGKSKRVINLKRGFRRIMHVLAGVLAGVAVICGAVIAVGTVVDKYNSEQDNLRFKKIRALDFSEIGEQKQKPDIFDKVAEPNKKPHLVLDEAAPKELKGGFWVNLSQWSLIGLCLLAGLGGGAAGYGGIWLVYFLIWRVYQFIRWLAMGFYDVNQES